MLHEGITVSIFTDGQSMSIFLLGRCLWNSILISSLEYAKLRWNFEVPGKPWFVQIMSLAVPDKVWGIQSGLRSFIQKVWYCHHVLHLGKLINLFLLLELLTRVFWNFLSTGALIKKSYHLEKRYSTASRRKFCVILYVIDCYGAGSILFVCNIKLDLSEDLTYNSPAAALFML